MSKKIIQLLKTTYGLLAFALLSGAAYFVIILRFILSHTSVVGGLLGFFFFPAITCGAALVLVKLIKQLFESGRDNSAAALFYLHAVLIIIAIVSGISMTV